METVDTVVAILAVVAVVGSAVGAFLYEPSDGLRRFDVSFTKDEQDVDAADKALASAGTATLEVPLDVENLTGLMLDVIVRPAGTPLRGAQLRADIGLHMPDGTKVAAPETLVWESAEADVEKQVHFNVAGTPYLSRMPAAGDGPIGTEHASIREARAWAYERYANQTGRGTWQVDVQITAPPGSLAPDATIALDARGVAERYHAVVQVRT